MKEAPPYALNLFKLSIFLVLLAVFTFYLILYVNSNLKDMLFFTGLILIAAFAISIIGFVKGLQFKPGHLVDKRRNRIGLIGNLVIICIFIFGGILLGIELNKYL